MTFSRVNNIITYDYVIDNYSVTRVTSIRDLGILLNFNLDFSIHINTFIKKAFKMLGFINRSTINFKNSFTFKTLYFSLVRSHLEFGSIVWSPHYFSHISLIENVQYKFLKLLCFKLNIPISRDSYNLQITQLGITSCDLRRKVADIMFLYDLLNGLIYSPELLFLIGFNIHTHGVRKPDLFHVSLTKNNYTSPSFFPRALSLANCIAEYVDFFSMSRIVFRQNVYMALNLIVNYCF